MNISAPLSSCLCPAPASSWESESALPLLSCGSASEGAVITLLFHALVERMSSYSKLRAHCSLKHPYRCRMGVMGLLVQVCTPNQPSALDIPFFFFEATGLCESSEKSKLCSKKFLGMCMAEEQKRDHFGSQQRFLPRIACKCSFRKGLSKKQ